MLNDDDLKNTEIYIFTKKTILLLLKFDTKIYIYNIYYVFYYIHILKC